MTFLIHLADCYKRIDATSVPPRYTDEYKKEINFIQSIKLETS